MGGQGIPLDEAILLSSLLGALLYGFSLLMFGGTVAVLYAQKASDGLLNRRMLVVACLLLLFSTAHFVIVVIRTVQGFVLFRNIHGGPIAFFGNVTQWTFVSKNYVYTVLTLIGDGVVLYRCYVAWRSKLIMIVPVLLWCAVAVTGIGSPYAASRSKQSGVFSGSLDHWIIAYYASTFATNLLTTILLAYCIWSVDRVTTNLVDRRKSRLRHLLHVIIDAGAIYSITLFAAILCFVTHSNGQHVIIDMIPPIIAITFYMVIIRVGLASRNTNAATTFPLKWMSASDNTGRVTDDGMQICVATATEHRAEYSSPSPLPPPSPDAPLGSDSTRQGDIKFDSTGQTI